MRIMTDKSGTEAVVASHSRNDDFAQESGNIAPIYIASDKRQLFAWLHTPAQTATASLGMVICKPFGFEAMCAHLSVRAFADMACELGVPTLRCDYGGSGDSEDLPADVNEIDAWIDDIIAAVRELQRRTQVQRVCLLGLRLGATLGSLVAARCPVVTCLIAVAPVVSGKRYVREMRNFELASAQRRNALRAESPSDIDRNGKLQVAGFSLNSDTMRALRELDLAALPNPPIARALIIDREDLPAAPGWRDALSAAGIATQYVALPGIVQMLMRPANLTWIPHAMIAAARVWLNGILAESGSEVMQQPSAVSSKTWPTMQLKIDVNTTVTEQPVCFRSRPLLFGVATLPAHGELRRRGVVLLNAGADHHIGPRRLYVSLAREWARNGYVVLRMDLSGLGDSEERPGEARNVMFPVDATEDVRAAVSYMREHFAVRDVTVAGICSGASHAIRAAFEGLSVNRVLLINPLIFYWKDRLNLDDVQPWEIAHKPGAYLGRVLSAAAWRKLLFGQSNIWRLAHIFLARTLIEVRLKFSMLMQLLGVRLKNHLGTDLKALKARGVRIVFVFSPNDAGLKLLQLQSGLSAAEIEQHYCLRMVEGADHEFTSTDSRIALSKILSEELYADPSGRRTSVAPRMNQEIRPYAQ